MILTNLFFIVCLIFNPIVKECKMAKIEIDSVTGKISEVSQQDNNAWVTVVLIILAICYFCFADDRDVELTKKREKA